MREQKGNRTGGRRARWMRATAAGVAVGGLAMMASACNGPLEPGARTVPMNCVRYNKAGQQISTYSSGYRIGITAPTWADRADAVAVQDATVSGAVAPSDWVALKLKTRNASPTYLGFFRSPRDDQFDNVMRVKVTGPRKSNMEVAVNELFIVHPTGADSYDYDLCKPKPGVGTRLTVTAIR